MKITSLNVLLGETVYFQIFDVMARLTVKMAVMNKNVVSSPVIFLIRLIFSSHNFLFWFWLVMYLRMSSAVTAAEPCMLLIL